MHFVPIVDPFAEADEDTGETKQSQNYIHIRIQRTFRNTWWFSAGKWLALTAWSCRAQWSKDFDHGSRSPQEI